MATKKSIPPSAASLVESIRDVGYTAEAAIADLIDNSITSGARNVQIRLDPNDNQNERLVIVDDGAGMSQSDLESAMRLGSRSPREPRKQGDLGRFGLGLKTASFSQCRSLTVVSTGNGQLSSAQWDLDLISREDHWWLSILTPDEIAALPDISMLGERGTYILWKKLDRFLEGTSSPHRPELALQKLERIREHLALVFHRYLSGEFVRTSLRIEVNGLSVVPRDPFYLTSTYTWPLTEEIVRIDGHEVRIQPFIIPELSKLTKKERDQRDSEEPVSDQGVYVYRNGRLLVHGGWFNLMHRTDATKLARVRIDFSSSLDEAWTIDIKKSKADPPREVRQALKQVITQIAEPSKGVLKGRAKRLMSEMEYPLWDQHPDRNGTRFLINREHPLVAAALNSVLDPAARAAFEDVLTSIEGNLPAEAIALDYSAASDQYREKPEITMIELRERLVTRAKLLVDSKLLSREAFAAMIRAEKPFSDFPTETDSVLKEIAGD